jgi:hypothetical protein
LKKTSRVPDVVDDTNTAILNCAQCARKIRVPTDRGTIRFTCPDCKAQHDWSPSPGLVSDTPAPDTSSESQSTRANPASESSQINIQGQSESRWKRQDKEGKSAITYFSLGVFYIVIIVAITSYFGSSEWVAIIGTLLGMAFIVAFFKAVRVFFSISTEAAVGLTVAFSFILGTLPSLIFAILPMEELDISRLFASEPVMEASHFKDVKVETTTPSDLDKLMEDW